MSKLDLSKFKKVASDGKSTTFHSPHGDEIKIAHAGLSKERLAEMEKLPLHKAAGGPVYASSSNQSAALKEGYGKKKVKKYAYAGPVDGGGGGDDSGDAEQAASDAAAQNQGQPPVNININAAPAGSSPAAPAQPAADNRAWYDKPLSETINPWLKQQWDAANARGSNQISKEVAQQALADPNSPLAKDYPDELKKAAIGYGLIPDPNAQQTQPASLADAQPSADQQGQDQQPDVQPLDSGSPAQAADDEEAAVSPNVGGAALQAQPAQQAQMSYDDHKLQAKQELSDEDLAWQHDLQNGHITPQTYGSLFANRSTLGKIGSIFGLMLSGAGSGLSRQPNAFLEMMNKEISNDLNAQMQSKANAQNFLRLSQQEQLQKAQIPLLQAQARGVNVDTDSKAFALAQARMLQSSYHKLVTDVAKMPEGPQKQAAQQQLGMLYGQIGSRISDINDLAAGASAYYNVMFGGQGAGGGGANDEEAAFQKRTAGLRMMGPTGEARAKDLEDKHMPGIQGSASVPLSQQDRQELTSGMQFDQKLNRFIAWTKAHSGSLSPSDINEGKAMAAELQGAYRQATHGGVYKEGEQNFISQLIDSDPTKFFNSIRVLPQLYALSRENQKRLDEKAKSLGFPGYNSQGQTSSGSSGSEQGTIERIDPKSGRTVIYDAKTKKPLRWK